MWYAILQLFILRLLVLHGVAETIKLLCTPLKLLKINTDDIKVMVSISLSMLPILKRDLYEVKEACIAKNITFNLKSIKIILAKFFLSIISRVNKIEESLIEKGYSNE